MKTCILTAAFAAVLLTVVTAQQCPSNWTFVGDSCYKWFSEPHYWFDAEQVCRSHQGHLVSIGSEHENTLVERLARAGGDAWIGRFCTRTADLNSSAAYAWTDGSDPVRYHNHHFNHTDSIHKLVIRTREGGWINSLYQERYPFVCKRKENSTLRCPSGWSLFQNHCYLMSEFESNFNEANFYCQNRSSHLVSVLEQSELDNVNGLISNSNSISQNPVDRLWLGLIKLNPCFPDSGGRELCYQWTDFSGKHQRFPMWQSGHPNNSDWTVNCVILRNDRLHAEACFKRHRFVCKSPTRNGTDGGGSGSVNGVVAAFDFRKGLENLVNPNTYIVDDTIGIPRSSKYGSCFSKGFNEFYGIGDSVSYNESLLSNSQWTIFMKTKIDEYDIWTNIISVAHDNYQRTPFWVHVSTSRYSTQVRLYEFQYQLKGSNAVRHSNSYEFNGDMCYRKMCNLAISTNNYQAVITINEEYAQALYDANIETFSWPISTKIFLGTNRYWSSSSSFCFSCFGIANKQLSSEELKGVFKTHCPSE